MNEFLDSILVSSMLKTSRKNCLEMCQKNDIDVLRMLEILENIALNFCNYHYMTINMANNMHLIYDYLLTEHNELRVDIVESYNNVKQAFNTHTFDEGDTLIFDDILRRQFGVFNNDVWHLYDKAQADYYMKHYDEIIDDIAFDFNVINYLKNFDSIIDNEVCKDIRFLKSLRFIIFSLDNDIDIYTGIKIIQTLKYRESLYDNNFFNKFKVKREQNKLIKRIGGNYGFK